MFGIALINLDSVTRVSKLVGKELNVKGNTINSYFYTDWIFLNVEKINMKDWFVNIQKM